MKRFTLGIIALLMMSLLFNSPAKGVAPLDITITPTYFIYLPLISRESTSTPTPTVTPTSTPTQTPTRTPTPTPTETIVPPADLRIVTLDGTSNPEVVSIKNFGGTSQDMTSWYLVSVVGPQTFYFPVGYVLSPGATVSVESYSNAINNPPSILFWTNTAIWNNAGDKAELLDSSYTLISHACYLNGCP